jgi:hypothetical protein
MVAYMETAEPTDLLERAFLMMPLSPDEISVDYLPEYGCGCEGDLPLPCWIMPLPDSTDQHPRHPASLICVDHSKLADPKFSLSLITRAISQNELDLPCSIDLHTKAADVGVPTSTYRQFLHGCV